MKQMHSMWSKLILMTILSFAAMFGLMYMMVDVVDNIYPNFNQFYMAGAMTAAMVIIEVAVMGSMYKERRTKVIVIGAGFVALMMFFLFTRNQTAVSDHDFLKAMIPHHAGALLMCKNPKLRDPEIQSLCRSITSGQQSEIDFMKIKLHAFE